MSGIREELRRLEEARDKGAISEETYANLRRQIMDLVEEAQVVVTQTAGSAYDWDSLAAEVDAQEDTSAAETSRPRPRERMSDTAFICSATFLAFVICLGVTSIALGDLMAGFTITLGLFAIALIWAAHHFGLLDPPEAGETDRLANAMARARRGLTERPAAQTAPEPPSSQH